MVTNKFFGSVLRRTNVIIWPHPNFTCAERSVLRCIISGSSGHMTDVSWKKNMYFYSTIVLLLVMDFKNLSLLAGIAEKNQKKNQEGVRILCLRV